MSRPLTTPNLNQCQDLEVLASRRMERKEDNTSGYDKTMTIWSPFNPHLSIGPLIKLLHSTLAGGFGWCTAFFLCLLLARFRLFIDI